MEQGVYCIPCAQCQACYIGETGRSLSVRLEEHRLACRLGNNYNAIATHSLGYDHQISFSSARIVYNSNNINVRKIAEGALISLNSTFKNNKGSTQEDRFINFNICEILKIKSCFNIVATLSPAALPLFSQVDEPVPRMSQPTGTYAVQPSGRPPDHHSEASDADPSNRRELRRSQRLRLRIAANQ